MSTADVTRIPDALSAPAEKASHPAWCTPESCDEWVCRSPLECDHTGDHRTRLIRWDGTIDPTDTPAFYIEVNDSYGDAESARWLIGRLRHYLALVEADENTPADGRSGGVSR